MAPAVHKPRAHERLQLAGRVTACVLGYALVSGGVNYSLLHARDVAPGASAGRDAGAGGPPLGAQRSSDGSAGEGSTPRNRGFGAGEGQDDRPSSAAREHAMPRRRPSTSSPAPHPPATEADPMDAWRALLLGPEAGAEHAALRAATFERYAALHRAIMDAPANATTASLAGRAYERRFIVVRPCCQLCNRLRVLVSALALGILTSRAVLVEFDADYYGRFADLFAAPIALELAQHPSAPAAQGRPRGAPGGAGGSAGGASQGTAPGGVVKLSWEHMLHGFLCDSAAVAAEGGPHTLELVGAPCFLHALHLHPQLRRRFLAAFGAPEGLFSRLFRFFLPLAPRVRARLDESVRALRARGPPAARAAGQLARPLAVGVHVRNGGDFRSAKLSAADWAAIARTALELVPPARRGTAVVFVATDGELSRRIARETFDAALGGGGGGGRLLLLPGLAKRKDCQPDDADCTTSREGAVQSLLELLLLAACDVRLLSPMSSFSEMAGALSARRAAYYHPDLSRKFHFESAVRVLPATFVPHTVEMPASISLARTLDRLPCGAAVRAAAADAAAEAGAREGGGRAGGPPIDEGTWTRPRGLRDLNGSLIGWPHLLAARYATID